MEGFGCKWSKSLWRCKFHSPRVYNNISNNRLLCSYYSSSTISSSSSPSLYKKISGAGDPKISMTNILEQWVSEGNEIQPADLQTLVTRLKNFRRYSHALQVSAWLTDKYISSMSVRDVTTQLELISRVHGLDQVENYFFNLPNSLRGPPMYKALLNCYASAKALKKAEDLMQKMKEMGLGKVTIPYNIMLKMYYQLEMYDKVELIMQEMEEKGLGGDAYTHRIQLAAFSNSGKVKEMEMVLMKMETNPENSMNFSDYITAANGFLKAGVLEKSLVMLRRAERLASGMAKKHVYQCLLTLYARAKVSEEVYRIWNLFKRSWDVHNRTYLCMISALVILDDLEGAERIVDEWICGLSAGQKVDFRIINPLARAYCKKGDLERAHALVDRLRETSGQEPKRNTWDILSTGYHTHNLMEDAVKTLKAAIVADGKEWKLHKASLVGCLDYLRMKDNPEELHEFITMLEDHGYSAGNLLSDHSNDTERQFEEDVDLKSLGFISEKAR